MKTQALLGISILLLAAGAPGRAEEKAERLARDAAKIGQVKKFAVVPIVTQIRFDGGTRIPDPARAASRVAAATRLADIIEARLTERKVAFAPHEAVTLMMKEIGWQPIDFYTVARMGSWDAPADTVKNNKADQAWLLASREEMKKTPDQLTAFKFHWHDLPEEVVGLASFKLNAVAPIDMDKAKQVAEKTGTDAVLYVQVGDMETHEASTGLGAILTGERFKTTRVHLYATLVSPTDGAILWQARAKGTKSQKSGVFTGNRAFNAEDRKAIEGAAQAVEVLFADLFDGAGEQVKEKDSGKG